MFAFKHSRGPHHGRDLRALGGELGDDASWGIGGSFVRHVEDADLAHKADASSTWDRADCRNRGTDTNHVGLVKRPSQPFSGDLRRRHRGVSHPEKLPHDSPHDLCRTNCPGAWTIRAQWDQY